MATTGLVMKLDNLAKVFAAVKELTEHDVLVGFPDNGSSREDENGVPSQITNAMIAFIQEHGSPARNIPARPFMVPGVMSVKGRCESMLQQAALAALEGDRPKYLRILNQIGMIGVNAVQAAITRGEGWPPLAESTLAARRRRGVKRTHPLLDTGQLRQHVQFVVRRKQRRFMSFDSFLPQNVQRGS